MNCGAGEVRLQRVGKLEDLREGWDGLAEGSGHPFGTWEWVSAWWRFYGEGRELYTFACFDADGRLAAILPLYVAATRPVRVARFLGYSDLLSPLCKKEDRPLAAAGLRKAIGRGRHGCRVLLAERLPGGQGWAELLGGAPIETTPDPGLRIGGRSWDEYLASHSSSFRKRIRRQERILIRDHGLVFRLSENRTAFAADFELLVQLHRTRFGDTSSGIFEGARGVMQREIAHRAFDRGWARVWIAELDGEPAAAYYGWRYAGSEFFIQSGRNPRFDRASVGSTLLAHVLRGAFDEGVEDFRFLAGDESYKLRFADYDYGAQTRVVASGRVGAMATAALEALPDSARARVMRAAR